LSSHDTPSSALIDKCVHCGFCLPTCPTYLLWGEEMDSPRGRIYLMKAGIEGRVELNASYVEHFDRCLGCLACVTACPSGVQYAPLIEKSRAQIEHRHTRDSSDGLFRTLLMAIVPYPARMRLAMLPLLIFGPLLRAMMGGSKTAPVSTRPQATDGSLWRRITAAMQLAPPVTWGALFERLPEQTAAVGSERLKVALLEGCVQRLSFAKVNQATVRVLAAEGCRVLAPASQGCCGALPLHSGRIDQARELARHNIEVFEKAGVDRIAINAAGCGSAMKEYGELFAGDPEWAGRAKAIAEKVRDVTELLV
jgi:glycolate oxidase iron-sulfur subunit